MSGMPEVVRATVRGVPDVLVIKADPGQTFCWMALDQRMHCESQVTDRRPLVLIDPEDAEQVESLCKRFVESGVWRVIPSDVSDLHGHRREQVAAALRPLAEPTPPEPQGLGAVVRGGDGRRWTRIAAQSTVEKRWATTSYIGTWAEIKEPVLMHEGWSE